MAVQVLDEFSYLPSNRILHKDVKIPNFLLNADRTRVVLCDFGLSAHAEGDSCVHRSPPCVAPNYVAPELLSSPKTMKNMNSQQTGDSDSGICWVRRMLSLTSYRNEKVLNRNRQLWGEGRPSEKHDVEFSAASDMWTLGVLLYIMLVGVGPFDSTDIETTFDNIRDAHFIFPAGVRSSANAKTFVCSLLAEDRYKRPSADEALRHVVFIGAAGRDSVITGLQSSTKHHHPA